MPLPKSSEAGVALFTTGDRFNPQIRCSCSLPPVWHIVRRVQGNYQLSVILQRESKASNAEISGAFKSHMVTFRAIYHTVTPCCSCNSSQLAIGSNLTATATATQGAYRPSAILLKAVKSAAVRGDAFKSHHSQGPCNLSHRVKLTSSREATRRPQKRKKPAYAWGHQSNSWAR